MHQFAAQPGTFKDVDVRFDSLSYVLQDRREHVRSHHGTKGRAMGKHIKEAGDSSGYESSIQTDTISLRKQETDQE